MSAETWRVELHTHTVYSKDCLTPLEKFIRTCKRRGIDRVAITDHNRTGGARELAKRYPDIVIVGEEIMTTRGELLAYFVQETIPPFLPPAETIKRLREQGAVISVAHPYDRLRKGAWAEGDLIQIIDQVDALEVFNSRCLFEEDNSKALALAMRYDKLMTVGSDAHMPRELGRSTLRMSPFEGAGSFFESLKTAQIEKTDLSGLFVHGWTKWAKWSRILGLRSLPEFTSNGASASTGTWQSASVESAE